MHAMRMLRIQGSILGSQSAAKYLELNGQKSITPLDWQASIAMWATAAESGAKNSARTIARTTGLRSERGSSGIASPFGIGTSKPNPPQKMSARRLAGSTAEIRRAASNE